LGYIAVAYGIQHAVVLTTESLDWPHVVTRVSMLLLALGVPVAITLAWYHGERVNRHISGPELSILSVLFLIAAFLFYVFVRPSEQIAVRSTPAAQTATAIAPAAKPPETSVAVLPFLNLSGDPKEKYFSDGMTEEITSALAQVKGLRVIGRTSAFAFEGKNENLRVIGQTLGATHLIEGSVRKEGNQLRITVQLIKADDDSHLWTQNYDRQLKDVFAVQEDVAQAVATSLQVPLGLKQGEKLVSSRDIDPDSYQDYLRAKALFRSRSPSSSLTAAIALLEHVLARQPNYAPAWALLAQVYALAPVYNPDYAKYSVDELLHIVDESQPRAEAAAHRAIELDPRNADAYTALGQVQTNHAQRPAAEQSFKQALSLDPLNPETLHLYSLFVAQAGHLKDAVAICEQLRSLDPLVPIYNNGISMILSVAGDQAQALAMAQALPANFGQRAWRIAMIYAAMKKYKEAADAILAAPRELYPIGTVDVASRLLRTAPAPADHNIPYLGSLSFVFLYVGLPERSLEWDEHFADAGYANAASYKFWQSDYAAVRKTERFKVLVRRMGLVDYWRAKGWPQFCHPTTGDNFVCN
jgi:TolB-like protein/Tfp pilus assembly protein PilF